MIDLTKFKSYAPTGLSIDDVEVHNLSGGRSSAYLLMMLLNGGFRKRNPLNVISFQNTGEEDETCYEFVKNLENELGENFLWLEYTLTEKFINELVWSSFSYEKFKNAEYTSIGQILNLDKLKRFDFVKSSKNFWYTEGFSSKTESIKVVDFDNASRNGKPFIDTFIYKCAIRIMKREGLILPSAGQRWCTGDMKEKLIDRHLKNNGIDSFTKYLGMRHDEPVRVDRIHRKNDKAKKIFFDCPLHWEKVIKIDVLQAWALQTVDLGLKGFENHFRDFIGNCVFCHLKSKIKKHFLIQNGYKTGSLKQMEIIANNYNGDNDAMNRLHGTYEKLEKEAMEMETISIDQVLSDEEIEVHCITCG